MTYEHISAALQCELMFLCFSGREISSQLVLCWQPQMNRPRLFCWYCTYTKARNLICGCGREELRVLERINKSGHTELLNCYTWGGWGGLCVCVCVYAHMGTPIRWGLLGVCGLWHVEHKGLICHIVQRKLLYTIWQKVKCNNLVIELTNNQIWYKLCRCCDSFLILLQRKIVMLRPQMSWFLVLEEFDKNLSFFYLNSSGFLKSPFALQMERSNWDTEKQLRHWRDVILQFIG